MNDYASNLRRLMARQELTIGDVAQRSGIDGRTIKGILSGIHQPHARTLGRLAAGLQVPADELFQNSSLPTHKLFDRHTNPEIHEVIAERPQIFHGWTEADFDELYSRFGVGGALTRDGVAQAAENMNRHRDTQRKVAVLLESSESDLLRAMVDVLYERARVTAASVPSSDRS